MAIGFVVESPVPLLFNKNMYNIPRAKALIGWDTYDMSTAQPWAFYYKDGERA
jgi:hypothetical protein